MRREAQTAFLQFLCRRSRNRRREVLSALTVVATMACWSPLRRRSIAWVVHLSSVLLGYGDNGYCDKLLIVTVFVNHRGPKWQF